MDIATRSESAQQRKGEYSPFKINAVDRHRRLDEPRSTKEGGIFPLQDADSRQTPSSQICAQQRKGEYSPFKDRITPGLAERALREVRSTKEGGIFPLQGTRAACSPSTASDQAPLNKGRGNIPPSSTAVVTETTHRRSSRSTKEGGIFPLQDADRCGRSATTGSAPLNKGRGNIPPSRIMRLELILHSPLTGAQQRKGEYSPFKA